MYGNRIENHTTHPVRLPRLLSQPIPTRISSSWFRLFLIKSTYPSYSSIQNDNPTTSYSICKFISSNVNPQYYYPVMSSDVIRYHGLVPWAAAQHRSRSWPQNERRAGSTGTASVAVRKRRCGGRWVQVDPSWGCYLWKTCFVVVDHGKIMGRESDLYPYNGIYIFISIYIYIYLYPYIYISIYIFVSIYIYLYPYIYIFISIYICIHMCVYIYHIYLYPYIYISIYIFISIYIYLYPYIYIYIHIYIYIFIHIYLYPYVYIYTIYIYTFISV